MGVAYGLDPTVAGVAVGIAEVAAGFVGVPPGLAIGSEWVAWEAFGLGSCSSCSTAEFLPTILWITLRVWVSTKESLGLWRTILEQSRSHLFPVLQLKACRLLYPWVHRQAQEKTHEAAASARCLRRPSDCRRAVIRRRTCAGSSNSHGRRLVWTGLLTVHGTRRARSRPARFQAVRLTDGRWNWQHGRDGTGDRGMNRTSRRRYRRSRRRTKASFCIFLYMKTSKTVRWCTPPRHQTQKPGRDLVRPAEVIWAQRVGGRRWGGFESPVSAQWSALLSSPPLISLLWFNSPHGNGGGGPSSSSSSLRSSRRAATLATNPAAISHHTGETRGMRSRSGRLMIRTWYTLYTVIVWRAARAKSGIVGCD